MKNISRNNHSVKTLIFSMWRRTSSTASLRFGVWTIIAQLVDPTFYLIPIINILKKQYIDFPVCKFSDTTMQSPLKISVLRNPNVADGFQHLNFQLVILKLINQK